MATFRERQTAGGERRVQAIVRIRGHRPLRETFSTWTAARRWAKAKEEALRAGANADELEAERTTVADLIAEFILVELPHSGTPKSRKIKAAHLAWWRRAAGPLALAQLTPAEISRLRQRLLARVKPQTTNRYLYSLSSALNAAVEWGWLSRNPVRGLKHMQEPPGRLRWLSRDEAAGLLEACLAAGAGEADSRGSRRERHDWDDVRELEARERLHAIVLAALVTGARQGELMHLEWRDVDLERGRAYLGTSKNRDRRTLHLPPELVELLRGRKRLTHFSGYVFASRRTKPGHPPRFPRRKWRAALRAAGIEDFRFHDLRHTFASWTAMTGGTLVDLSHLLGHRSLAMVKRYAHLAESHGLDVSRRVSDHLFERTKAATAATPAGDPSADTPSSRSS